MRKLIRPDAKPPSPTTVTDLCSISSDPYSAAVAVRLAGRGARLFELLAS